MVTFIDIRILYPVYTKHLEGSGLHLIHFAENQQQWVANMQFKIYNKEEQGQALKET
jgi:hypothetical protein